MVNWNRRDWMMGSAAMTLAPALWSRAQTREAPIVIRIQAGDQIRQLPVALAYHMGYFRDEGLDVSLAPMPAGIRTLEEVARVPAVIFAGSFERTLYLHAQGHRHTAFALVSRAPQMVLGTSALHMPAGMQVSDLFGAQIGVRSHGSLSQRVAQWVIMRSGLQPTDVQFIELPDPKQAMAALNSRKVDALCYGDPIATQLELTGMLRILTDTRTMRDTETVFGGPVACTCLSAPTAFIDANQPLIQSLTNAVVRAMRWLRTAGPSDLMRHVPEPLMHGDRKVFLEAFFRSRESLSTDGFMADGAASNVLSALDRLRLPMDWQQVHLAGTYTNRFVTRSRQRYRA